MAGGQKRGSWESPVVGIEGRADQRGAFFRIYEPEFNVTVAWQIFERNGHDWGKWFGPCPLKGIKPVGDSRCKNR